MIISFPVLIGFLTYPGCVRKLPISTAPRMAAPALILKLLSG